MKKVVFSVLLCAALCLSILPLGAFAADEVAVTYELTYMTSDGEPTLAAGDDLYVNLTADEGYMMPKSIVVTIGGVDVSDTAQYDIDITQTNGTVLIRADAITGDIVITAEAVAKCSVTFIGNTWSAAAPVPVGQSLNAYYDNPDLTLEKEEYVFGGWFESTDGGETLASTPFDFDTVLTTDVTVYPLWTPVEDTTTTTTTVDAPTTTVTAAPTDTPTTTTAPATQSPQTGDDTTALYAGVLMLCAGVIIALAKRAQKA